MGLQDVLFKLKLAFDSPAARDLSRKIQEEVYYHALATSCDLAESRGPHPTFPETRAAAGAPSSSTCGASRRPTRHAVGRGGAPRIRTVGLRNSLLVAIAPTATIASIVGACECVEPQVSNLFKRETLSGEFLQINRYLVDDLKALGLWTGRGAGAHQARRGVGAGGRGTARPTWRAVYRTSVGRCRVRGLLDRHGRRAAGRSSTRASRFNLRSSKARPSARCRRCTSTPGRRGSKRPTTSAPGPRPRSPKRRSRARPPPHKT